MSASLSLCILLQIFDVSTPKLVHPFWDGWHCLTSDVVHYIHTNPKLGSELTVAHSAKQNDVRKVQHFTNVALWVRHSPWHKVRPQFGRLNLATIGNISLRPSLAVLLTVLHGEQALIDKIFI